MKVAAVESDICFFQQLRQALTVVLLDAFAGVRLVLIEGKSEEAREPLLHILLGLACPIVVFGDFRGSRALLGEEGGGGGRGV